MVYHFTGAQEQNRFGFPRSLRVAQRNPKAEAALVQYRIDFPPVVHPLVITQRESGRKVLKLSPMHAQSILGMNAGDSDELLHELADHLVDARYAYFHTWQTDDAIIWDNWRSSTAPPACRSTSSGSRSARRSSATTSSGATSIRRMAARGSRRRFDD